MSRVPALALLALVAVLGPSACSTEDSPAGRQAEVAERGAQVMPFDLDATTHDFEKTASGGAQLVTADAPGDVEQVGLIRQHLRSEAAAFARGDYRDPMEIHGHDMAGVPELRASFADVDVTYAPVPAGGSLTFVAKTAKLIAAIHAWFDQQVADHGAHAGTAR